MLREDCFGAEVLVLGTVDLGVKLAHSEDTQRRLVALVANPVGAADCEVHHIVPEADACTDQGLPVVHSQDSQGQALAWAVPAYHRHLLEAKRAAAGIVAEMAAVVKETAEVETAEGYMAEGDMHVEYMIVVEEMLAEENMRAGDTGVLVVDRKTDGKEEDFQLGDEILAH